MKVQYFAYGSNLNPDRMNKRKAFFTSRKPATLTGYMLVFNKAVPSNPGEGVGNIIPDENAVVEGALYEITEEGIKRLDSFEGYPVAYRREEVPVYTSDGTMVKAVTYIANEGQTADGLKPSKEYLSHYLKGKDLVSDEYYLFLERIKTFD